MAQVKNTTPFDLANDLSFGTIPSTSIALTGLCGSGKTRWLETHLPEAVWINSLPDRESRRQMGQWRLHHHLGSDPLLFALLDEELHWRCPQCGQLMMKSRYVDLDGRLRRDFTGMILLGFPYSGYREVLVKKGFWRRMEANGSGELGMADWLDLDVLVDRLDPRRCDPTRLSEAVEQSLVAGLGTMAVWHEGQRYVYGSRFSCSGCDLSADAVQLKDLLAWSQGKKAPDPDWLAFEWQKTGLIELLNRSPLDWLSQEEQLAGESWWPSWMKRLQVLNRMGLGGLSLGRTLDSLSSGERSLIRLGRILEWNVSGQDLVLEHPEDGLGPSDLKFVWSMIEHLVGLSNRVWLESHSEDLIKKCAYVVTFDVQIHEESTVPSSVKWESCPFDLRKIKHRIRMAEPGQQGALLCVTGARGVGKSRLLGDVLGDLKKKVPKGFRGTEFVNGDPWVRSENDQSMLDALGLWNWLTDALLSGNEARGMRLLPCHFDRCDPLGACPGCGGVLSDERPCPDCYGTGLTRRILELKLGEVPVLDFWTRPLISFQGLLNSLGPRGLAERLESLKRVGMTETPGIRSFSRLSHGQKAGLEMLRFLWNASSPEFLAVDEAFRGLDIPFRREVSRTMKEKVMQGSWILCAFSYPLILD